MAETMTGNMWTDAYQSDLKNIMFQYNGLWREVPAFFLETSDAYLFVDDAHGIGVIGENPAKEHPYGFKGNGIVNYFGMDYEKDHVIYISGLSKAFSSFAAFITCCDDKIRDSEKTYYPSRHSGLKSKNP
ncbi:MAG: aminotransferase class I/II-fold pyridoxal phosphate-dependent enzyme [Desulfobacteraceae bacterium]|nr:aminotransferase class I/II-fold pyridoxal phosphate-dependent enzyme [Desulfobacteraceae bacterium]